MAASFSRLARSAPENPGVAREIERKAPRARMLAHQTLAYRRPLHAFVVGEFSFGELDLSLALDVNRFGIDDHDLVHARVGEELLEGTQPERLVGELANEPVLVDRLGNAVAEGRHDAPERAKDDFQALLKGR